ncbi:hypothetical protein JCM9140_1515 [Halalkalibacter wakoensis JCM 9140]|uniref:PepSY domain-containing protein n=1 Tax=Halalkalibacter wakoensis JCM 9140 TaxID=1236970 RepID=W4Q0B8_9BACI|nr:PepSY domain-containing protein [Halalkalibacter wakoensis]GAE25516.1 hypothetical protein JCM9140_1515 [Halalkalibacter wakoensis JCM 9140]
MKKWIVLGTSLLIAGGTAIGVASAEKSSPIIAYESAIVLEKGVEESEGKWLNNHEVTSQITEDQAVAIALDLLPGRVKEVELDSDDGRLLYEIEIKFEGNDYDLEIDAFTGEIVEIDDNLLQTPIAKDVKVNIEEARNIALTYIGSGSIDDIELEVKKGRYVYEVEIEDATGDDDVDVYIDANTGEVIGVDWD